MSGFYRHYFLRRSAGLCLALWLCQASASHAALTVSTTRVVFESDKRSVSLVVSNPSNRPFAVQTWVNTEADDATTPVPFMSAPPLFRLDPGKEQQVQINGLPNTLPQDRESLFYFNVQEIPQASETASNVLNIALRTRLKFFYRPSQLKDSPVARLKDLNWSIERRAGQAVLMAHNPTPFHVTLARVDVHGAGRHERLNNPQMLAPMSSRVYPLSKTTPASGLTVEYSAINDYGGQSTSIRREIQFTP